jgi:hypothetical protein
MVKSSDHQVNRSTYSGQKKRYLVKFMSLLLSDGYVLDMIGPFHGISNDAHITRDITEMNCSLLDWCEKGDTMVVDRSFRDVINTFEQLGCEPQVRSYLQKDEK